MGLKICKDEEKGFFRVNEGKLGQRAWKLIKKSPKEAIFSLFFFFFFQRELHDRASLYAPKFLTFCYAFFRYLFLFSTLDRTYVRHWNVRMFLSRCLL